MLRSRVVTALALALLLVLAILFSPPNITAAILGVILLIGAWEWSAFLAVSVRWRVLYVLLLLLTGVAGVYWTLELKRFVWTMSIASAWWVLALLWIVGAPQRVGRVVAALAGALALLPTWFALVHIDTLWHNGAQWTLFILALSFAADTGAFFAGRQFGRLPLAPRVSPNKTWEGVMGTFGTYALAGSAREDSVARLNSSVDVINAIMATPDKGIPEEVLNDAKCILVVPNMIKGGFVFGGKHGRGVASCRTAEGWSAPAFVSVGGGSAGFQIGLEGVDLVMLVMNDKGLQQLLSSKFELTGEGSVAAGPVGRHASAGTDWKMTTEVLTYSRSKGVFAGLTLEGAVVEQDNDSTRAIYGEQMEFRNILSGKVATPKSAEPFIKAVAEAREKAHIAEVNPDTK